MEYCARCLGARAASTVAAQSKTRVAVLLTLGQMKLDTELCEDFVRIHNPAVWEEIPVNTDLCLHIQRCAVQATGKALWFCRNERGGSPTCRTERTTSWTCPLSRRGFLARHSPPCKAKKEADETLQLCLPRKPPAHPQLVQRNAFTLAATQVLQFKVLKLPPTPSALSGLKSPLSSGDAAGSSSFSNSTDLAFQHASRDPPCPHLPAQLPRAMQERGGMEGHFTAEGSAVAPLMSTSTRTHGF